MKHGFCDPILAAYQSGGESPSLPNGISIELRYLRELLLKKMRYLLLARLALDVTNDPF
jgi:hypothetical protein